MSADPRRVWVGCLACYNGGRLTGDWMDPADGPGWACPVGPDHEETWVFDAEGFGTHGEDSPSAYAELDAAIDASGEPAAYLAWRSDSSDNCDVADFQDQFCGKWASMADYAESLAEVHDMLPADLIWPLTCISWVAAGRELELGGDNWTTGDTECGGVWVFRSA